jgi:hypothetical protein
MFSNLRGETIPMACSCFLEKQRNIQLEDLDYSTQGFSLKQLFRSGKSRRRKKKDEDNNLYQENVMKQEVRNTQLFKEHFRNESVKTSNQTSNISNLLKIHNSYSNHLSQPFEVVLSVNMSSNLQVETIPMACSCFFGKLWNNHKAYSVYSIQKPKSEFSFGEGNMKQRGEYNWLEKNIKRKFFREGDEIFIEEKRDINQLFVLLLKHSDLDVEAFTVRRPPNAPPTKL